MKITKLYNNKQCLNEFTVFKYKSVALRVRTVTYGLLILNLRGKVSLTFLHFKCSDMCNTLYM